MADKHSPALVARALAESTVYPDKVAAARAGIGLSTLRKYRREMAPDSPLAAEVTHALANLRQDDWAAHLKDAITNGILFLSKALTSLDPADPKSVIAAQMALTALFDAYHSDKIFKARFPDEP